MAQLLMVLKTVGTGEELSVVVESVPMGCREAWHVAVYGVTKSRT